MSNLGKTNGNTGYGGLIKSGGRGSIVISFPAKGDDRDTGRPYNDMWNQLVAKEMYITREAERVWGSQPSIYWFLAGSFEQAARWCCVWTGNDNSPVQDWFFPWIRNVWSERNEKGEWESLLYVAKTETLGYGQTLELAYLKRFEIPFRSACFKLYTEQDLNSTEKWLHKTQIWKRTRKTAKGKTVICLHPRDEAVDHMDYRGRAGFQPEWTNQDFWERANEELDLYRAAAEIACSKISEREKKAECDRLFRESRYPQLKRVSLDQNALSQLAILYGQKMI